ncbi:PadR family transcriptional regulator [Nocardia pseudovaccinii]|uniref:PadR family transcriptional regulator n=1 Tax=Nocardia pseudovaccinii TaxID=189540 RepID=UPI0007A3A687|nr:helix-turn-helix transcriptional regulator [Nocardia pseudovaccinii]
MGQHARPSVTPLAIAVLALLEERPMHPYEAFQLLIARREDMLVKVRPGSLYHTVTRLADQGLVQAEGVDREGNRPERTTYRITESGRATLRSRIAEILRDPGREYPMFPVGLAEAHNLPATEVLALLRERVDRLAQDLADVDMMSQWAGVHDVPRRYWIVLPYLHATIAAEIAWVHNLISELESGEMEWNEFDPATGVRVTEHQHPWSERESSGLPPVPRRWSQTSASPP